MAVTNVQIIIITCIAAIVLFILIVPLRSHYNEQFVAGENAYMEPEFNVEFEKCLQAYPIPFRGPINSGWYGCLRQTDELLKNLGQPCER